MKLGQKNEKRKYTELIFFRRNYGSVLFLKLYVQNKVPAFKVCATFLSTKIAEQNEVHIGLEGGVFFRECQC